MSSGIKIEVGEYETREGYDVKIIAVIDGFAIGYFTESGPETISTWRSSDGWYYTTEPDKFDLVLKKPKRIKREVWLAVHEDDVDGVIAIDCYATKNAAQENRFGGCIAIVPISIDCMEGDGLDGSSDGDDA